MNSLKIIITVPSLAGRSGSVLYVRDLALGLSRLGHLPVVFTHEISEVGQALRFETIPVVGDLNQVGFKPDIVIGNGHPELVQALLHFPNVAGIHVCHAWDHWITLSPGLTRVRRVAAVDITCRDWLTGQHGLPEEKICVIQNAVDVDRFQSRGPLPERPRNALVFSSYLDEHNGLSIIRSACTDAGITLDVVGERVGRIHTKPEELLGQYDIVFAKARSALEAMAVGCAVILCNGGGAGPLVTSENIDFLWPRNFGRRVLHKAFTVSHFAEQLQHYNAADALMVSQRVRREGSLESFVSKIASLCHQVIEEQDASCVDREEETAGYAAYLKQVAPMLSQYYRLAVAHHDQWLTLARIDAANKALSLQYQEQQGRYLALLEEQNRLKLRIEGQCNLSPCQ